MISATPNMGCAIGGATCDYVHQLSSAFSKSRTDRSFVFALTPLAPADGHSQSLTTFQILMADFKHFSFEDFNIPPLDLPTSSVVLATNDTDQQPATLRSSSLDDEDAEDEVHPEPHQQESTTPKGLLEPNNQYEQGSNYASEDPVPSYDGGGRQALTEPPKHQTHPAAYSDDSALATRSDSGDRQPLVIKRVPSNTFMVNRETTKISVTSDGWVYRSIGIPPLQTARDIRVAMRDTLGLASDAPLLIYLTTTDRVTSAEISTDEALTHEVSRSHGGTEVKFLVLQDTQNTGAGPQQRDWMHDSPIISSSTRLQDQVQQESSRDHTHSLLYLRHQAEETVESSDPISSPWRAMDVSVQHRGLRIDTSAGADIGNRSRYEPVVEGNPFNPLSYKKKPQKQSAWDPQNLSHSSLSAAGLLRASSSRYRQPRTTSPPPMDSGGMFTQERSTPDSRQSRKDEPEGTQVKIRDGSRARNTPADFVSGELCDDCQTCGHRRFYCNVCSFVFCDPCWERQFPHRMRPVPGALPHERTDHHIAKKIGNVLAPQLKEEQREKLHMDDIDTTWFGVVREGHERPLLQDYGRYATLIAGVKDLRLGAISSLSTGSDYGEALYPSLVSFVGQTGAGKSSLIKLLIDLKSDENETFETPVVGAAGRDVATSEDVHLYLDPDSSESQAPLLFADCEGLEGGERDPVGAKLKRKLASSQNNAASSRRKPTSERELVWADTPKKQSRDFAVAHLYPRLLYTFSDVIVFVLKNPRYVRFSASHWSTLSFYL